MELIEKRHDATFKLQSDEMQILHSILSLVFHSPSETSEFLLNNDGEAEIFGSFVGLLGNVLHEMGLYG